MGEYGFIYTGIEHAIRIMPPNTKLQCRERLQHPKLKHSREAIMGKNCRFSAPGQNMSPIERRQKYLTAEAKKCMDGNSAGSGRQRFCTIPTNSTTQKKRQSTSEILGLVKDDSGTTAVATEGLLCDTCRGPP